MARGTARAVGFLVVAALAGAASACGLEDPNSTSVRRGTLQFAFPGALAVGTAVWQAQLAGELPKDALARREDLSPDARARLRLIKANALLTRLAARWTEHKASHPPLALVLVGPILWTRFAPVDGALRAEIHVEGPVPGDVVGVTELAVVEALVDGTLDAAAALDRGLLRLYAPPADAATMQRWLRDTGAL